MTEVVLGIKRWGNSLGLCLPAAIAREAHLQVNQRVRVAIEAGQVVVTPVAAAPLTLAQRLTSFDPTKRGGEAMTSGPALGAERW